MSDPIEFYFDFTSPYGYLMSEKIDELAAKFGRKVKWRPILLGVVFKATGAQPLAQVPLKGEYSKRDFARSARFLGVPYAMPAIFPIATQNTARAYYWLHDRDCARAWVFAHAAYRGYFVEGRDINDIAVILDLAQKVGAGDTAELQAALGSPELKDRLRTEVDAALAKGVCGSPYVIIDNEPFLGADRLPQIEKWLESGGF
ncbi:MAG: 2-hydroxychromene-2-carboxylate isomerase [Gammaproteobacteria bacterium]|nr:2-hydroxychromene-2-carboxylate isomerase [Gammaproteobacteria bacterium]MBU1645003.1 2-hydroxychromene-2-carboxylate isomerase [Gammaproteobacteria bacterium]MBU1971462.1 2-hydroxychromene-2-carboxylate isomerase [Gammaproteobacteria bacterium]